MSPSAGLRLRAAPSGFEGHCRERCRGCRGMRRRVRQHRGGMHGGAQRDNVFAHTGHRQTANHERQENAAVHPVAPARCAGRAGIGSAGGGCVGTRADAGRRARQAARPALQRPGLGRNGRAAGAGHHVHCHRPATAPAADHTGADRCGRAPLARERPAALARRQSLREGRRIGGAGDRPDGRERRRQGATARQDGDGAQPRHRRGHQGRRHHPDQPACGVGREEGARDLRQRPRVRRADGRRPTRERPGRAQGQQPARRPGAGDDALHRRPGARRRGRRGGPPLRHRPVASVRASSRAWSASSARPKASMR